MMGIGVGRDMFNSCIEIGKSLVRSLARRFGYDVIRYKDAFHDQQTLSCSNKVLTIFDVGANVGQTTAKYKTLFPNSTIYSFEPFPESFGEFRRRFGMDSLVKPIQMAVADRTGTEELYVRRWSVTNSLSPLPKSGRRYYPKKVETITDKIEVPVITIDDFCREESISEIHILKMDVEGGELKALQGVTEKLKQHSIALIYIEVSFVPLFEGLMFYEISNFLSNYGYTLFDIYNNSHARNGQLRSADAIFVSPQIRRDVIDSFDPEP